MSEFFEVRPYREGDENNIVTLLDQVFIGLPHFDTKCSLLDHWKWKYVEAHYPKISRYLKSEVIL